MANEQQPTILMQANGTAPILSYNVPEPTSYSGRNYIDLQIDGSYWKDDPGLEPNGPLPTATQPAAAAAPAAKAGARALKGASDEGTPILQPRPAVSDEPVFGTTTPEVMMRPREDPDPTPVPEEYIYVTLTSHANGATVRGPHTGAQVTFHGTAHAEYGTSKVEVKVGTGAYQRATLSGNDWSFTHTFAQPGTAVAVRVLLTGASGKVASQSITVNVALDPAPDTTDPVLSIASPADGTALLEGANGTQVVLQGTASDVGSGIQSVQVSANNGPWATVTALTAGFGTWTHTLVLGTVGTNVVAVRALDQAERSTTRTVTVEVVGRDTSKPVVAVTSPAPAAALAGPFEGLTVNVEGTTTDESAIAKVEVFVNGSVAAIPAMPRAGSTLEKWSAAVTFNTRGQNHVTVVATDVHGNQSELTVPYSVDLIPKVTSRLTRLILVESYRLSSFLGNYGAGRTIKTFSLLPGEKTKLSVKTYTRSEQERKDASSILDSYSDTTQKAFEDSMEKEQTNQKAYQETQAYSVSAEAKASWGWGSAGVSASASVGTNAAREEFAKNISAATQKHVSEASAKRDVQVNTSYEVSTSTGEETAVEREIQNVNMGRTLNFVFRQMNQEYITLLHLVDLRVGYFKVIEKQGEPSRYIYREVTLPQLYPLLQTVLKTHEGPGEGGKPDPDRYVREVYDQLVYQVMNIYDYQDVHHSFAEWRELQVAEGRPHDRYLRVRKDYVSTYYDAATETTIRVPGIILAANRYVLRTEGIVVDAVLGAGNALDPYSSGLQDEAVRERRLANDRELAEIQRLALTNRILAEKDGEMARLYALINFGPQPLPETTEAEEIAALTGGD